MSFDYTTRTFVTSARQSSNHIFTRILFFRSKPNLRVLVHWSALSVFCRQCYAAKHSTCFWQSRRQCSDCIQFTLHFGSPSPASLTCLYNLTEIENVNLSRWCPQRIVLPGLASQSLSYSQYELSLTPLLLFAFPFLFLCGMTMVVGSV